MFDSGSDVSLMDQELANQLGIVGPKEALNVSWMDEGSREFSTTIADINISGTLENDP